MSEESKLEVIGRSGWRKEFVLEKAIISIGSDPGDDISLDLTHGAGIAPRHLQLIAVPDIGYRLVNLGESDILLGTTGERNIAPRYYVELADGEQIKVGEFTIIFHGEIWSSEGTTGITKHSRSKRIGLSLTIPHTELAPGETLEGVVTVHNLGDFAGVQFELGLKGIADPTCYELEPGPILSSGAEKEVAFRLYHHKTKPLAGNYKVSIWAAAPKAYPAEQVTISQMITVLPFYHHDLEFLSLSAEGKPVSQPPESPESKTETDQPALILEGAASRSESERTVQVVEQVKEGDIEVTRSVQVEEQKITETQAGALAVEKQALDAEGGAAAQPAPARTWWARFVGILPFYRRRPTTSMPDKESVSEQESGQMTSLQTENDSLPEAPLVVDTQISPPSPAEAEQVEAAGQPLAEGEEAAAPVDHFEQPVETETALPLSATGEEPPFDAALEPGLLEKEGEVESLSQPELDSADRPAAEEETKIETPVESWDSPEAEEEWFSLAQKQEPSPEPEREPSPPEEAEPAVRKAPGLSSPEEDWWPSDTEAGRSTEATKPVIKLKAEPPPEEAEPVDAEETELSPSLENWWGSDAETDKPPEAAKPVLKLKAETATPVEPEPASTEEMAASLPDQDWWTAETKTGTPAEVTQPVLKLKAAPSSTGPEEASEAGSEAEDWWSSDTESDSAS